MSAKESTTAPFQYRTGFADEMAGLDPHPPLAHPPALPALDATAPPLPPEPTQMNGLRFSSGPQPSSQ